jgi:hypothetical protein
MFRRPSIRSTVTTLAAATVLVGGADLASYAATGQPLVLGHSNSAGTTTSLKNLGRGPALSLNSSKHSPPLVVNSSKLVKHLNADRLGGKSANQINPAVTEYRIGSTGSTLSNDAHFFTINAPAGDQEWSMTGIWTSTTSTDQMLCLIVDKRFVADPSNTDYIYALFTKQLSDPDAPFIQQHGFAHFGKHQKLLFGCSAAGDTGPVKVVQPLTFTFHKIAAQVKHGKPFSPKSSTLRHLRQLR